MESVNLLSNKISLTPEFHAVIELAEKNGVWFYGYRIVLKKRFRLSPIPGARSATMQRGEDRREIALLFALYDISKQSFSSNGDDLDEAAIGGALIDEAARELKKTTQTVFTKHRQVILDNARLRAQFHYMLPEYRSFLDSAESYILERIPVSNNAPKEQLSLF